VLTASPAAQWPEIRLQGFDYPDWMNAAVVLSDRMAERRFGDNIALIGNGWSRTCKALTD
jgi:2-aminobenzoate-CoA ligase